MLQCNIRCAPNAQSASRAAVLRDLSAAYPCGGRRTRSMPRYMAAACRDAGSQRRRPAPRGHRRPLKRRAPEAIRGSWSSASTCGRSVDARVRKVAQDLCANARVRVGSDPSSQRRYAVESGENRRPLRVIVMHGRLGQRRRRQHHRPPRRKTASSSGISSSASFDGRLTRSEIAEIRRRTRLSTARKKASKISRLYGFNVGHRNGRQRAVSRRRNGKLLALHNEPDQESFNDHCRGIFSPGENA